MGECCSFQGMDGKKRFEIKDWQEKNQKKVSLKAQ